MTRWAYCEGLEWQRFVGTFSTKFTHAFRHCTQAKDLYYRVSTRKVFKALYAFPWCDCAPSVEVSLILAAKKISFAIRDAIRNCLSYIILIAVSATLNNLTYWEKHKSKGQISHSFLANISLKILQSGLKRRVDKACSSDSGQFRECFITSDLTVAMGPSSSNFMQSIVSCL